jgi:hypothetical protein
MNVETMREKDRKAYKMAALSGLLANPNFYNASMSERVALAATYAELCVKEDANEWLPDKEGAEAEAERILNDRTNFLTEAE